MQLVWVQFHNTFTRIRSPRLNQGAEVGGPGWGRQVELRSAGGTEVGSRAEVGRASRGRSGGTKVGSRAEVGRRDWGPPGG